ncbi:hypothetical protein NDU88_001301 [Pleurodeles waltl]|uniref:Uncharacterized protein n=1 Tax=Pleurodeles waltl TaxID=8319 RepID=A0AAV7RAJ7_PLEWA|nr:hypothetical protein NDU88_001301 [Pleurodeles waltl]
MSVHRARRGASASRQGQRSIPGLPRAPPLDTSHTAQQTSTQIHLSILRLARKALFVGFVCPRDERGGHVRAKGRPGRLPQTSLRTSSSPSVPGVKQSNISPSLLQPHLQARITYKSFSAGLSINRPLSDTLCLAGAPKSSSCCMVQPKHPELTYVKTPLESGTKCSLRQLTSVSEPPVLGVQDSHPGVLRRVKLYLYKYP